MLDEMHIVLDVEKPARAAAITYVVPEPIQLRIGGFGARRRLLQ
jgi:hypothetical protein